MALPPLLIGADHVRLICSIPAVPTTLVTTPGAPGPLPLLAAAAKKPDLTRLPSYQSSTIHQ
jgi:hypothetical protein